VWGYEGYEGIFPGPTIKARHGRTTVIRHLNRLAIPTVVHLHGGATPSESDGFPTELQIPDGHPSYVLQSAMCDVTPSSSDPGHGDRSRSSNSTRTYVYPNKQRAATLWYHDHAMGFNGRNIYMGLAGLYLIEDEEEAALPLPRGICDIPLMLFMRTFGADGALVYNSVGHTGAQGDVMLVNGAPWPRLEVARRKYRFRILNASNATTFRLALSSGKPLVQIATDGGLLPEPVTSPSIPLAMAERVEVVIDFAEYSSGSTLVLQNLEMAGVLGKIMRFDVTGPEVHDDSSVPQRLATMTALRPEAAVRTREFRFGGITAFNMPPVAWAINGNRFDPCRVDAAPRLGDTEIWHFYNSPSRFHSRIHPPHIHLVQFQILERNGKAPYSHETGWKDTLRLEPGEDARVIMRFGGYKGRYILHCHNLEHEDYEMMARFDVV